VQVDRVNIRCGKGEERIRRCLARQRKSLMATCIGNIHKGLDDEPYLSGKRAVGKKFASSRVKGVP